jgi:hypothetical protein
LNATRKILMTALLSLIIGAGGTYAIVRVSATCSLVQQPQTEDGLAKFLAPPRLPFSGNPSYGPDMLK